MMSIAWDFCGEEKSLNIKLNEAKYNKYYHININLSTKNRISSQKFLAEEGLGRKKLEAKREINIKTSRLVVVPIIGDWIIRNCQHFAVLNWGSLKCNTLQKNITLAWITWCRYCNDISSAGQTQDKHDYKRPNNRGGLIGWDRCKENQVKISPQVLQAWIPQLWCSPHLSRAKCKLEQLKASLSILHRNKLEQQWEWITSVSRTHIKTSIRYYLPSSGKSEVQRVRLSLNSCIIKVLSL